MSSPFPLYLTGHLPLCKDCRHIRAAVSGERMDRCGNPKQGNDLVRGDPIARPCHIERERNVAAERGCGRDGHWFEAPASVAAMNT